VARKPGGPEVLTLVEVADPLPGPGELRIDVKACTVNPTDTMRRSGAQAWHPVPPREPFGLGMEVAGVIDQVGPGVDLKVGDPVMAIVLPSGETGSYAERVVVPASQATLAPRNVDLAHAATLPMNGLTALMALEAIDLPAGEVIAVTGAAGAVGGYVIELAKTRGLRVIADSAPTDEDLVRRLGADFVVPRGAAVAEAIRDIVPEGVQGLVDGSIQLSEVLPALSDRGTMALLRPVAPEQMPARTVFLSVSQAVGRPEWLADLRRHVEEGHLTPRVAYELPLASAEEAHRMVEQGGLRGRIVLIP
jgi:NADPH:quinone reductase-like Zn-dependent oxidoreductase